MAAHAKLSASGSSRWLNCTGSIKAEEPFENKSSPAAMEGTCAHELADLALSKGINTQDYLGKKLEGFEVNQEMIDHVDGYVTYVKNLGGEQFYEVKLDYSHLVPDGFGTSDAVVIKDNTIHVVDLKYGKGVEVSAENNSQGMLYGLGALNEYDYLYDFETVIIDIYQPRIGNFSTWELSVDELRKFGEYASERAKEALTDNAPRTPSDKACQWCRAKATCPALYDHTQKIMITQFDDLDEIQAPDTLSDEILANVYSNKKLIESWLKAVEDLVSEKLFAGEPFPGYKLVAGRSLRKWENAEDAQIELIQQLGDHAFEKKLLTPAKAEKILGAKDKNLISHLIIKPEGKPTVAPMGDKREAIGDCSNDFDDIG